MTTSTKEQRQRHVDLTNASMRLSGIEPDADTLALQRRYIDGEISVQDLLDWVGACTRQFQRLAGQDIPTPKDAH
jgi:hypothetical protein